MFQQAKRPFLLLTLLLLAPLATAQVDTSPLGDDEGYLLVAVSTPRLLFNTLYLDGKSSYEFEGKTFDKDINYRLIRLPAGDYYWSRMDLTGTGRYFKFKKRQFPMSVTAGRVNYGGMFLAEAVGSQRGTMRIVNRVTSAIEFIATCCADLLQQHPLKFATTGDDPFVDYYSAALRTSQSPPSIDEQPDDHLEEEQIPALLAAEYFRRSKYERPKLSPDGQFVLMFETHDGLRELLLVNPRTTTRLSVMKELRGDVNSRRSIYNASWVDNERFVFRYEWARSERLALGEVVFSNGQPARIKIRKLGEELHLLDPLPAVPKRALVVLDDEDDYVLYDMDVTDPGASMGARPDSRLQEKFRATSSWLIDSNGRMRAAVEYDHDKGEKILWYRTRRADKWRAAWRGDPGIRMIPVLASDDDQTLTVISNEHTEFSVLTTYNQKTREYGDTLYTLDDRDIESAIVDPLRTRVVAVTSVEDGLVRNHYVNDAQENYPAILGDERLGEAPAVVERSLDERFAIVRTSTSDNPGAYYWIDAENGESASIGELRPWLSSFRLGSTRTISTTTSDGLVLESFLTLPDPDSYPRPPLIVMPHGGPIAVRDTRHFDATVQLLSVLGYAVLQTNYRGSGGRGKAFLEKGYGEWGRGIERDIHAAMDSVLELGIVDEDKSCIFGSSYGGYSALITAILTPDRHQCAASFAGVTDLPLLFHEFRVNRSNLIRTSMERIVGDPDAERDVLMQFSPVFNADAIEIPVLLAHGAKDNTVQIEHFDRMRHALRHFGKDAEFLVFENEGHGFRYLNSSSEFYRHLDRLFRRAMDLPAPSLERILKPGEQWPAAANAAP